MCGPVTESKGRPKNYTVEMRADQTYNLGHHHDSHFDYAYCDRFADVFKAVREFWSKHPGANVEVKLKISPLATDHLKVEQGCADPQSNVVYSPYQGGGA